MQNQPQNKTPTQTQTQEHNNISLQTMVARKNAEEVQGGVAHRYKHFSAAQFCIFAEGTDGKNWQCVNCERKIAKRVTHGNKPVVVCLKPDPTAIARGETLHAVVPVPKKSGGIVPRRHRTAPRFGVGFEIKKILAKFKIELPSTCACNSRAMLLNDMAIDEVEKIRDKIMVWFEDEAHKRAIYFDHDKANKIIDIAIRRTKKAALKQIKEDAQQAEETLAAENVTPQDQ